MLFGYIEYKIQSESSSSWPRFLSEGRVGLVFYSLIAASGSSFLIFLEWLQRSLLQWCDRSC